METELLCNLIMESKRIVVFTGAAVSIESGIDLRTMFSEDDLYDLIGQNFIGNPESRKKQWRLLSEKEHIIDFEPNQTHYTLAEMDKLGKLDYVITENIDDLLQRAGVSQGKIIELYGNLNRAKCLNCGKQFPMKGILQRVRNGIEAPECPQCAGLLKPDAIFYHDELPEETIRAAIGQSQNCDLFISLGSSLATYPPAYLIGYAKTGGAILVIVSVNPTLFDKDALLVIQGNSGTTMAKLVEKLRERMSL